jgi:hypothetical protein
MQDRRALPLVEIPDEFAAEELVRVRELADDAGVDGPVDQLVSDAREMTR